MAVFHVRVPDDLNERFRQVVFKTKGMKKGNLAEAVVEALQLWIRKNGGVR